MLDPRRWPWWGWVVAVVVLLLCVATTAVLGIRHQGVVELKAVATEIRSQGRGLTPADLIARAPAVDRSRQARLWLLVGTGSAGWSGNISNVTYGFDGRFPRANEVAKRDAETERLLTASAGDRTAWRKLYQEGPVVISVLGWLAEDLPDPANAGVIKAAQSRFPNLLAVRALATALATEARTAADPRPALADLDALIAAQHPPGSLIDVMIQLATANIRDQAWLEAASRGVDPALWIDQRDDCLALVGDAFMAERMLFSGALYQDAIAGRSISWALGSPPGSTWKQDLENWTSERAAYFTMPSDTAFALRCMLASEDLCRTGVDRSAPLMARMHDPWFRMLHPTAMYVPNLIESAITAAQAETSARRLRVTGALIHAWQATGALPADDAAADFPAKDLLAAQRRGAAILYQRLTPTRFRLWTDPATPPSDLIPAGRIAAPKPITQPWGNHGWCTELDVGAFAATAP